MDWRLLLSPLAAQPLAGAACVLLAVLVDARWGTRWCGWGGRWAGWVTPATQRWLAGCLPKLRHWKAQQPALCFDLDWDVLPGSQANYFCAQLDLPDLQSGLLHLRSHGIALRDCASFGLLGVVRLGVMPRAAQAALRRAWLHR